ncbi:hypothetical protein ACUN29_18885 [Streptomyces sp. WC2508]|uniref:hypothetical protein n=1 Tax=unclassified Streptomyces TaxID=2593676 RepID=UPI0033F6EEC0
MNLLVVDWDFFFPTPASGGPRGPHDELFNWLVADDEFHTETVWEARLRDFRSAGIDLPQVEGWQGFWDRFAFAPGASLAYADSNAWAAHLWPSDLGAEASAWDSVHLYDAHHDAGYRTNHDSFDAWKESGDGIRCENWMLAHAWAGSDLHVRFPPWRESLARPPETPLVPVTMTIDDGTPPAVAFDLVFVCRSGAWVPPWADGAFSEFLRSAPMPRTAVHRNRWVHPRPDPARMAEMKAALYGKVEEITGDS